MKPIFNLTALQVRCLSLFSIFCVSLTVEAAVPEVDLSKYQLTQTFALPPADFNSNPAIINAHEVSAIAYNWDTGSFFVVGDEGGMIVEVNASGEKISHMVIIGFNDPEGLAYTGDGNFVIVEERNRDAYKIHYQASSYIFKTALTAIDLGGFVDNIGIEGIAYDRRDGRFITVKEKSPQEVNINNLDFGSGQAQISPLFIPQLGVQDIADVLILANAGLQAQSEDLDNLILISQESSLLLEVSRSGEVLSQLDISNLPNSAEGITMDADGNLYVVAENGNSPMMAVFAAPALDINSPKYDEDIPFLPPWAMAGLALLIFISARRQFKS